MQGELVDEKDFLHRVDLLNLMGQSVMISKFRRYFQVVNYFAQFKLIKLRMVVGLPTFDKILDAANYTDLRGGLLEAMGALFQDNVKVYLYPALDSYTGELVFPEDDYFNDKIRLLWKYLNANGKIIVLQSISSKNLGISSEFITEMIENADEKLSQYLPEKVYQHICGHQLFGYGKNKIE
jgi:hypothetical protein